MRACGRAGVCLRIVVSVFVKQSTASVFDIYNVDHWLTSAGAQVFFQRCRLLGNFGR